MKYRWFNGWAEFWKLWPYLRFQHRPIFAGNSRSTGILQDVRVLQANRTQLSTTSETLSYLASKFDKLKQNTIYQLSRHRHLRRHNLSCLVEWCWMFGTAVLNSWSQLSSLDWTIICTMQMCKTMLRSVQLHSATKNNCLYYMHIILIQW